MSRLLGARSIRILAVALALSAIAATAALAHNAASGPIPAPGATAAAAGCTNHGTVVWMVYAKLDTIPSSGTCWSLVRPVSLDKGTYQTCNVSGAGGPTAIGTGGTWMYDDTNQGGHSYSNGTHLTDLQADNSAACGGRTSYFGVFMAASGGFHYAWNPTFDFEENYNSSHAWIGYTLSTSIEKKSDGTNMPGSAGGFNPVPTVDAATPSVASHITAECYDSPDFTSDYYFGLYNGTEVTSATVNAIVGALNTCYH